MADTGTLMPTPQQQFLDNSGAPVNGGLLYTYAAGTTTNLATYSDSSLSTPNANPIVLDSAGRPTTGGVYLSPVSYKFVLKTSGGTTLWTQDNVGAIPPTSVNLDVTGTAGETLTAGQVVYLSDGQGSRTAGRWYLADADTAYMSAAAPMIGMTTSALTSGASGTIRTKGRVTGLTGLTAGTRYFVSATAGGVSTSVGTFSRFVGVADSTTTLVFEPVWVDTVRLPDTDNSHALLLAAGSNLTADRTVTITTGDASRTLTLSGNATVDQDTTTTSVPSFNVAGIVEGRLTLTSNTPVTTGDVSAATSVYWTPFGGNRIALYDGSSKWVTLTFSQITISLSGLTASKPYDVFLYSNAGLVTAETLVWTNDTTRATALTLQDGVYVKSGQTSRRYVGTFYCNSTGGKTDDTVAKRYLFNYYNRVTRPMRVLEANASWTYTTATFRQARASTANQLDVMVGVAEEMIDVQVGARSQNGSGNVLRTVSIGEDGTTPHASTISAPMQIAAAAEGPGSHWATLRLIPAAGRHYYTWLEYSVATGTTNWTGSDGGSGAYSQSGIHGIWRH